MFIFMVSFLLVLKIVHSVSDLLKMGHLQSFILRIVLLCGLVLKPSQVQANPVRGEIGAAIGEGVFYLFILPLGLILVCTWVAICILDGRSGSNQNHMPDAEPNPADIPDAVPKKLRS